MFRDTLEDNDNKDGEDDEESRSRTSPVNIPLILNCINTRMAMMGDVLSFYVYTTSSFNT
jgi:hypothetical protein